MSREHITILHYLLIIVASLAIIFICHSPAYSQTISQDVSVVSISGNVLALKGSESQWRVVNPGDILSEGDSIKTLEGAKAKLQFPSGSTVELGEMTTIGIDRQAKSLPSGSENTELSLSKGRIKNVIESLLDEESTFQIKTPTAVAGVVGTRFYLSVVEEPNAALSPLTGQFDTGKREKAQGGGALLADLVLGGVKECFAEGEGLVTELYVAEGVVKFSNIISNLSYNVSGGSGSYADGQGGLAEPQILPPDLKKRMTAGFDEEGGDQKGGDAKKGESSTTEGSSAAGFSLDLSGIGQGYDPNEYRDEQNDNNSLAKRAMLEPSGDLDGDGVINAEDDFPYDPEWSKWSGSSEPTGNDQIVLEAPANDPSPDPEAIIVLNNTTSTPKSGKEDYELAHELIDIYEDIADMKASMSLAELDNSWEQIRDSQAGKVVTDIHGNRVRMANYIMRPGPNKDKVAAAYLCHRRDGEHAGVSSLVFEVAFVDSGGQTADLTGVDLKTLPWSDILNSSDPLESIKYSTKPDYYLKPGGSDPSVGEEPAFTLTARNPHGDYIRLYEGFGDIEPDGRGWQQPQLLMTNDLYIYSQATETGTWKNTIFAEAYTGTINGEGTFTTRYHFPGTEPTDFQVDLYSIDDDGNILASDLFKDGSSSPMESKGLRTLLNPDRTHNLECVIGATELGDRKIDVIVSPILIEPYLEEKITPHEMVIEEYSAGEQ